MAQSFSYIGATAVNMGMKMRQAGIEGKNALYAEKMKEKQRILQHTAQTADRLSEFNEAMGSMMANQGAGGAMMGSGSDLNLIKTSEKNLELSNKRADLARYLDQRRSRNLRKTIKAQTLGAKIGAITEALKMTGSAMQNSPNAGKFQQGSGKAMSLLGSFSGSKAGGSTGFASAGKAAGTSSAGGGAMGGMGLQMQSIGVWKEAMGRHMNILINSKGGSLGW